MNQSTVRASTSIQNRREMRSSVNWKRASSVSRAWKTSSRNDVAATCNFTEMWKGFLGIQTPTDGEFIKGQNDVSWTETHISLGHYLNRCLFALHRVLKRNQKIYKSSCLKESSPLWPFLFLCMNYFHPVSFIYLWSWEFSCDRRSLWCYMVPRQAQHWEMTYFFVCIERNEKFYVDRSEFLSTATLGH